MIVSDDHKLVFVHIPKCAGVSVKAPLRAIDSTQGYYSRIGDHPDLGRIHFAHIVLRDLATFFPDDFTKLRSYHAFAVVRDPRARFLSAVFQRLREFKGVPQSGITADRIEEEAGEIISVLEGSPDRLDLEFVHFNRQVDYLEFAGERLVDEIFAIERMPALVRFVSDRTGIEVSEERENRSTELRHAGLRPFIRALRQPYAMLVPHKARMRIRGAMVARGLYGDVDKKALIRPGGRTDGFIRNFYAKDFEVHAAAL